MCIHNHLISTTRSLPLYRWKTISVDIPRQPSRLGRSLFGPRGTSSKPKSGRRRTSTKKRSRTIACRSQTGPSCEYLASRPRSRRRSVRQHIPRHPLRSTQSSTVYEDRPTYPYRFQPTIGADATTGYEEETPVCRYGNAANHWHDTTGVLLAYVCGLATICDRILGRYAGLPTTGRPTPRTTGH